MFYSQDIVLKNYFAFVRVSTRNKYTLCLFILVRNVIRNDKCRSTVSFFARQRHQQNAQKTAELSVLVLNMQSKNCIRQRQYGSSQAFTEERLEVTFSLVSNFSYTSLQRESFSASESFCISLHQIVKLMKSYFVPLKAFCIYIFLCLCL